MNKIVTLEKDNWVYIRIPKVGSTSFRNMNGYNDGSGWSTYSFGEIPTYDNKYVFTFIRDPFKRLVSAYKNRIQQHKKIENKHLLNTTFEQFVKGVYELHDRDADEHIQSQSYLLDQVPCDVNLFKLDNFNQTIEFLNKNIFNKPLTPKHDKKSGVTDHMSYYNDELKKLVESRYMRDISLYKKI